MTTREFRDSVPLGWFDVDQRGRASLSAIVRKVPTVGSKALLDWAGVPMEIWFRQLGVLPIVTHARGQRRLRSLVTGGAIDVRLTTRYGFFPMPDQSRRFGGIDRFEFLDAADGLALVTWDQHWLWHKLATGDVVDVHPESVLEHDDDLGDPIPRPTLSGQVETRPFRWTSRETDGNQHIGIVGHLERAENALAEAGEDLFDVAEVQMWFRRPARVDEAMTTRHERRGGTSLVEVVRSGPEEVCATISLSA